MKVLVTEDGLHAREVNIYTNFHKVQHPGFPFDESRRKWQQFEDEVKTYDLTEWCEPGSVIGADLVWQSYDHNEGYKDWGVCEFPERERNNGYRTRQAYQPIKLDSHEAVRDFYAKRENIDEDKPKEETVEEAAAKKYPFINNGKLSDGTVTMYNKRMTDLREAFIDGINYEKQQSLN